MKGPHPRCFSPEKQKALVADYLNGMYKKDICEKYGIVPPQMYAYLRRNGVQPNRNSRKTIYRCVVCGQQRPLPPYSYSLHWTHAQTCGDEECKSLLMFHPELRTKPFSRDTFTTSRPSWIRRQTKESRDFDLVHEITSLTKKEKKALSVAFELASDERAADALETAKNSLWSRMSRLSIALHLRATEPLETSMTLYGKDSVKAFLEQFFGNASDVEKEHAKRFDALYLWQCCCEACTTYVVRSLEDFPTEEGEYGICRQCSCAALEIVRRRHLRSTGGDD